VAATVGRKVSLVRTNPKTGAATRIDGTLRSDAEGVVFESTSGVEALRCSGLPEAFEFEATTDAAATPTLSALVRSPKPITAQVRLSYLARGFDWMANYVATLAPDGKTMDLGAWVTLANSNSTSFPAAHAQVVAGRLNRESGEVEPVDGGGGILADCWPRGSTSDTPDKPFIRRAEPLWDPLAHYLLVDADVVITAHRRNNAFFDAPSPVAAMEGAVAKLVKEEELGDLKLYRVPDRTSVTSRQIKQVRLLDRHAIPAELLYGVELSANVDYQSATLRKFLRTRNDRAHHLGLPLPSGQLSAFVVHDGASLLINEAPFNDTALDEEFEISLGEAPDVQLTARRQEVTIDPAAPEELRPLPGVSHPPAARVGMLNRIYVTNARDSAVSLEIGLRLIAGDRLVRASLIPVTHHGRPTFRLELPAGEAASITYQTERPPP
jgi:hypothetical protein